MNPHAHHQDARDDDIARAHDADRTDTDGTDAPTAPLWLFDLGNSRLKFAPLLASGLPGPVHAVAHDGGGFTAGWDDALPARFDAALVSSVAAPALRVDLLDALTRRCARIVRPCTLPALAGLRIAYADPASLGVDRFLALLGARARGAGPWLVVGVGTALTLDLVDAEGLHRGGRIAPSPALMRASLHARAAQLPERGGDFRSFADNTADALRSGCDGAALALIDRARDDAQALLGTTPRLLVHGGGASAMAQRPEDSLHAPALVLKGMAVWATATSPGRAHTMPAC